VSDDDIFASDETPDPITPQTEPSVVPKIVDPQTSYNPAAGSGCLNAMVVVLLLVGFVAYTAASRNAALSTQNASATAASPQNSALPILQPSGDASTPIAPSAPVTPPVQPAPISGAPTPETPTQQPPPEQSAPPPPPAGCQLPGSLSVSGTDPSSLAGSGGGVTVVSLPVVISTGPLIDCGQHYHLSMHGAHGTYDDCETSAMTDDVSGQVQVNDFIQITLEPPPNNGC
jgi:hypothetical protein